MPRRLRTVVLGVVAAAVLLGGIAQYLKLPLRITRRVEAWRSRPRVLAGGDAFELALVSDDEATRQTGQFDGEPGDDLALVEFGSVRILTPATLAEQQRFDLAGDLRAPWTPSMRLARLGGSVVVVDTGGGLDNTRVRDLDGSERWRYRPQTDVPATSLIPADLDADGDTEFYATITSYAVRLDGAGQEVWRAPFSVGQIVATAPQTRRDPAWIVAQEQGRTVVWDSRGTRLGELTMKDAHPLGVIDRADGRFLLTGGGPAVRAVGLDGHVAFTWTVDGMTVASALPLSLDPGAPPAVALIANGGRSLMRWRLQVVSADATLLYDEILNTPTALLKARGADGVDRLFVDRAGLFALRRRAE
jgi:hypothetical protein